MGGGTGGNIGGGTDMLGAVGALFVIVGLDSTLIAAGSDFAVTV